MPSRPCLQARGRTRASSWSPPQAAPTRRDRRFPECARRRRARSSSPPRSTWSPAIVIAGAPSRFLSAGIGDAPETEMPPGNKGKTKLKKLYRKVATNKAYHSGERSKDLISHLDMAEIRASAPVQELGCSSIRARGSFRLDWGRMAGRKQFASGDKRTKAQFTS